MREDLAMTPESRSGHWDEVYQRTHGQGVSWYQETPTTSLTTILELPEPVRSVVDVGGGASALVDRLLASGVRDVTVIDISDAALVIARERLGTAGLDVQWVVADVVGWQPSRMFDVWHDRAVFHFLGTPEDRRSYVRTMTAAVRPGGHAVIATFAPEGPERCSNLPTTRYSAAALSQVIGPGFQTVRSFNDVHVTPAGTEQPFTWVVLRRPPTDAASA